VSGLTPGSKRAPRPAGQRSKPWRLQRRPASERNRTLKTTAAVLFEEPAKCEIAEFDLGPPNLGESPISMTAAGMRQSDHHVVKEDLRTSSFPTAGGHEGAGNVAEIGPNTPRWSVGDKVVLSFLPICGLCKWCASGGKDG
jgi:Zn-dependent alcohol dehydrogenase